MPRLGLIKVIAFVLAIFTLYGCGAKAVLYGTIMLVLGIPVYVAEASCQSDYLEGMSSGNATNSKRDGWRSTPSAPAGSRPGMDHGSRRLAST